MRDYVIHMLSYATVNCGHGVVRPQEVTIVLTVEGWRDLAIYPPCPWMTKIRWHAFNNLNLPCIVDQYTFFLDGTPRRWVLNFRVSSAVQAHNQLEPVVLPSAVMYVGLLASITARNASD